MLGPRRAWHESSLRAALRSAVSLLPPGSRGRLWLLVSANMATSLLDLIGVALVGLLSLQLVAFVQVDGSASAGSSLLSRLFPAEQFGSPAAVVATAIAACLFLVAKSITGAWLSRRTLRFLAGRQVLVSQRLIDNLFRRPLSEIEARTSQETAFSLLGGVNAAIVGLLGAAALAAAEITLLLVLGTALLVLNPGVTLVAAVFFLLIAVTIHRWIGGWAAASGRELADATVGLTQAVQEGLSSFREIFVSDRMASYTRSLGPLVAKAAQASASITYIGQVPKYVYETALILGAILLGGVEFTRSTPAQAVATVTIFLAAGSRIMPSMLRLQNCLASIRTSAGQATPTFTLFQDLEEAVRRDVPPVAPERVSGSGFVPAIVLDSVTASYPGATTPTLRRVSLAVAPGSSVAVVGPTGAGKSTLADVILGVLPVQEGSATVGGTSPRQAIARWPGSLAYVPQHVGLVDGSVRDNITLGLPSEDVDDERCWQVLQQVRLADFLRDGREGLQTLVGEHGARLSGGQRQRLGLARALYGSPKLLVLDEATSALDAETESSIGSVLRQLHGDVTTVVIAHRLATVRDSDQVVYVSGGQIVASGAFQQVRDAVPQFDQSARLLGL